MNQEFLTELRDLCNKHLMADQILNKEEKPKKSAKKADAEVEPEAALTIDDVRAGLMDHSKRHGKENTFKLLIEFKAKTVSEVKEKDYKAIFAKAKL